MKKFIRVSYELFKYRFHCFRNTHFERFFNIEEGLILPYNAIVHNLGELEIGKNLLPNLELYDHMFNFSNRYYLYNNNPTIEEDFKTYNFPDKQFSVVPAGLVSKLNKFRTEHASRVKVVSDLQALNNLRKEFIGLINNASLGCVRMTGLLVTERFIEHILNGTLDKISQLPTTVHHYIPIRLPRVNYKRTDFVGIMKRGITPSSVLHKNDPFYILLAHLMCYSDLSEIKTPFDNILPNITPINEKDIPVQYKDRISFIFYNEKYYCIYTLSDLIDKFNQGMTYIDRFLLQLNKMINLDESIVTDSSTIEEHEENEVSTDKTSLEIKENIPITEKEQVVSDSETYEKLKKTITPEIKIESKKDKDQVSRVASNKKTIVFNNKPVTPVYHENHFTKVKVNHTSPSLHSDEYIDKPVQDLLNNLTDLTDKQKARIIESSQKWKNLIVNDKPLIDIVNDNNGLQPIKAKDLTFLKDTVADPSFLQAKIVDFDQQYLDKLYERNIYQSALSLNKVGYFVTDIKTNRVSNKLDDFTEYTFKFEDIHFRSHSFKVVLPNIQPDGTILSRGSIKKIYKQRVNKPICKIGPSTISLFSDYNKYLVELVPFSSRQSIIGILNTYLTKKNPKKIVTYTQGRFIDNNRKYPLELSQIATTYSWIKFNDITLNFNLPKLEYYEDLHSYLIGNRNNELIYMNMKDELLFIENNEVVETSDILTLISDALEVPLVVRNEYTEMNIISKAFPVGIILAYRLGLENLLKLIKIDYDVYQKDDKNIPKDPKLIKVKLNDITIVAEPFPYYRSFIFNGLNKFDLSKYSLEDLNDKETYYDVFSNAGYSPNYLLEINNFFDFFVDPVTYEVLLGMGEPTKPEEILIRCNEMLQTTEHIPNSSVNNFRSRSHGKIPAILYNELTKQMAAHRRPINQNSKFSINPQAVFQRVTQDALTENADINNPIGAIKDAATFSYTGFGGRNADSFVIKDRTFPKDAIGVISEATVDSSNVAIRAQYSLDPNVVNLNGMEEAVDINDVEPANMLSITSLLIPALTQDDKILIIFE